MTSQVEIVNRGLGKIGEDFIVSLTQDIESARIMNAFYPLTLRFLLRSYTWNCALSRVILAPLSTAPAFDFQYQFQLPSDCLRPILPRKSDWVVEGKKILTNEGDTLRLRYVRYLDDPNDMDDCFVEVFACKLAAETAEKITQSSSKRQTAEEEFKEAMRVASRCNAYERIAQEQAESSWVDSRIVGISYPDTTEAGY